MRAGASPSQKGTDGGAPWASTTRTMPASTRRIRQDVLPEEEDVARHALDGPVLVDGADHRVVGIGHHLVVRRLRNGAARGERDEPRAAPAPQHAVDAVAMQVGAATAAAGLDPVGEHLHDRVEVGAREVGIGRGPPHERVEVVLPPGFRRAGGHDLLREDVERRRGGRTRSSLPARTARRMAAHSTSSSRVVG